MKLAEGFDGSNFSLYEAILEKCRRLSLNRLTPDLGILPRKVSRGAPFNDAVVIQTGLE
jgi:hypothetical protein